MYCAYKYRIIFDNIHKNYQVKFCENRVVGRHVSTCGVKTKSFVLLIRSLALHLLDVFLFFFLMIVSGAG